MTFHPRSDHISQKKDNINRKEQSILSLKESLMQTFCKSSHYPGLA